MEEAGEKKTKEKKFGIVKNDKDNIAVPFDAINTWVAAIATGAAVDTTQGRANS